MAASQPDIASQRLAIELMLADITAELQLSQSLSQREKLNDQRFAHSLQLQELGRLDGTYAGQRMQQSMYTAMLADSRAIADQRQVEAQAIADRVAAAATFGNVEAQIPLDARQQISSGDYDDECLTRLEEITQTEDDGFVEDGTTVNGSSVDGQTTQSITSETTAAADEESAPSVSLERYMDALRLGEERGDVQCAVCTSMVHPFLTITLACGDVYCNICLARRYEDAIVNEGAYPIKCCRLEIPMDSVRHLLPLELRNRFAAKSVEWSDINRVYCHEPTCSTYIPHTAITGRRATCSVCLASTCAECKGAFHTQPPCLEDTANDEMLQQLATENHWPECPGCKRYVEITHGCNHMTCRCRTQFCYECNRTWRECTCVLFTEARLLERAAEVAERQGRANVEEVAQEIVSRHECDHRRWRRTHGGECDECAHQLPDFLWRCDRCHLEVCHRCRYSGRL